MTKQWALDPLIDINREVGTQLEPYIRWYQDVPGARLCHLVSFTPLGTGEVSALRPEQFLQRLACYLLVSKLPDEALPELFDSVTDILNYYTSLREESLALPSAVPTIPARVGQAYTRSPFTVPEE